MEKLNPRLLILLPRVPFPLDKGDKLRAYHQIVGLNEKFRIILVCLNTGFIDPNAFDDINPYCEQVHVIHLNKTALVWRLILNVFSNKPFQVAYYYSKQAHKELDAIIEKYLPQRFYCQLIRVAEYAIKYTIFEKTLDYMDALSVGMYRRAESSSPFLKPLLRSEANRLKNYEEFIFNSFEKKTIISEQDREHINHPNSNEIKVIPNGISKHYFDTQPIKKKYDLCFTGNMSYAPNVKGAQYLVKKILPLLENNREIKILISGKTPLLPIKRLANDNITISGWVDDMRTSYLESKIFVAPMIIGSGLQNKLLEAMAIGIPCITTSLANKALGATTDEEILIADSPEEFASHIENLLKSEELRIKIGNAGKFYIQHNFSWNIWNDALSEYILS